MPKNKKGKETSESRTELFFGIPDDENISDEDFVKAEPDEFEFVVGLTDDSLNEEKSVAVPDSMIENAAKETTESNPSKEKKSEVPAKTQNENPKTEKQKPQKEKTSKEPKPAKNESKITSAKEIAPKRQKEQKPQSTVGFVLTVTGKLLLICAIVAAMLAWVYQITDPIIKENELAKKEAALAEIFPEMVGYGIVQAEFPDIDELYTVTGEGGMIGYCASVSPNGFGGAINMMVGIGTGKTVIGVNVIGHSETPNVGTKALDGTYLNRYIGESGDRIELGRTVDAYAGATVSSKAVNAGINSALYVYDDIVGAYASIPEPVTEAVPLEGIVSIEEALHGADGYGGFYGWILDEHAESTPEVNFSPFEEIYCSKVKRADGSWLDHGFAAVVNVTSENGSAKIMVGTYYNTQLGVKFLDYEGEGFKKLALDTEYMANYKMNIQNPVPLVYGENIPAHTEADAEARIIAEKAAEVLAYYPEYLEQVKVSEEVTVNE